MNTALSSPLLSNTRGKITQATEIILKYSRRKCLDDTIIFDNQYNAVSMQCLNALKPILAQHMASRRYVSLKLFY